MFDKFWESIGSELANQWRLHGLTPALVFWSIGLLLWTRRYGFTSIQQALTFENPGEGALAIGMLLLLIIISTVLVDWLTYPALRFLEGYWPDWYPFGNIKYCLTNRLTEHNSEKTILLSNLKKKGGNNLTTEESLKTIQLESELSHFPRNPAFYMPTQLGNILRAAEEYPYQLYGLEVATTWSRLWILLPDIMKQELVEARSNVNVRTRYFLWCLLTVCWIYINPLALLIPLLTCPLVYRLGLLDAVKTYGQLLRVTYDLYRFELYKSMHIAIPSSLQNEETLGRALTRMLKTGLVDHTLKLKNSS